MRCQQHLGCTNPHVLKQGCRVPDACRDTLFVGRQLLQLPQEVPQSLQLKSSQHMFRSGKPSCLLLFVVLLELHLLRFSARVNSIGAIIAILIIGFEVRLGQS